MRTDQGNDQVRESLTITAGGFTIEQLQDIWCDTRSIALDSGHDDGIDRSAAAVEEMRDLRKPIYGINTGFGKLAQTRISDGDLHTLQRNLILSHCCGTGALLDDRCVRLIMALKISSLGQGYSGIRRSTIDALIALFNAKVYPCIPEKGSVGASGDLAPLAHMSAALLGVGTVRHDGQVLPAEQGLAIAGLEPVVLIAKEGLALINGTQVSTALALDALFRTERLLAWAVVSGALTVEAMLGSTAPFDRRIHAIRNHPGQQAVAKAYRTLLENSEINASHAACNKVQDPYSLRCQPQVMGAALDSLNYAASVLLREANAVTDNPLIFVDTMTALSGGNFHAEPVALVADQMAVAIAEIGAIAERRLANLTDQSQSGLPAFLVNDAGLNSGFMLAQVTAAAVASENKSLAHPASVDSLPTSANQEDHVSMATFAARRLRDMVDNTNTVVAIELLAAVQGLEFHRPLRSSATLEEAAGKLRNVVRAYDKDRFFAPDIEAAKQLLESDWAMNAIDRSTRISAVA
ncbi:MAG: histidine ammonia-lyase [Pseudomonadota bacterium]